MQFNLCFNLGGTVILYWHLWLGYQSQCRPRANVH